ncbi:MAG: hypothetical protein JWQ59_1134 [Cryobacterium sp.]|jgi:hypothetical protein|nr:hypothetical protein [Cryobacterium sp.]
MISAEQERDERRGPLRRPVGWWLKEADARLNAAFDQALEGTQVDRRGWQALNSLSSRPLTRADLAASLTSFDAPDVIHGVIVELERRGWAQEVNGLLRLTSAGVQKQADLAPLVERVRERVRAALPPDEYVQLVRLLARFTEAL